MIQNDRARGEERGTDWKEAPNQAAYAFNIVKAQSLANSLSKHVLAGIPRRKVRPRQKDKAERQRAERQLVREEETRQRA